MTQSEIFLKNKSRRGGHTIEGESKRRKLSEYVDVLSIQE
jgi:hypothetical protein